MLLRQDASIVVVRGDGCPSKPPAHALVDQGAFGIRPRNDVAWTEIRQPLHLATGIVVYTSLHQATAASAVDVAFVEGQQQLTTQRQQLECSAESRIPPRISRIPPVVSKIHSDTVYQPKGGRFHHSGKFQRVLSIRQI